MFFSLIGLQQFKSLVHNSSAAHHFHTNKRESQWIDFSMKPKLLFYEMSFNFEYHSIKRSLTLVKELRMSLIEWAIWTWAWTHSYWSYLNTALHAVALANRGNFQSWQSTLIFRDTDFKPMQGHWKGCISVKGLEKLPTVSGGLKGNCQGLGL